jgi:hypothetical protein
VGKAAPSLGPQQLSAPVAGLQQLVAVLTVGPQQLLPTVRARAP